MPHRVPELERQLARLQKVIRATRWIVIWTNLVIAFGWLFGPDLWTSGPSFKYLHAVNIDLWSLLLILAALCISHAHSRWYGFCLTSFIWSFIGILFLLRVPATVGWGAPFLFGGLSWLSLIGAVFTTRPKYSFNGITRLLGSHRR